MPAVQGVRTYVRLFKTTIIKGTVGWHFATGESVFFASLNSNYTYAGAGAEDSVNNWTQLQEVGTDLLFNHDPTASDDGRVEVKQSGLYLVSFSGCMTPLTSLSTWEVGIGKNGLTLETPKRAYVNPVINVSIPFHVENVISLAVDDDIYVVADRTAGTGGLRFDANSCSWYMRLLRP